MIKNLLLKNEKLSAKIRMKMYRIIKKAEKIEIKKEKESKRIKK